MERWSYERYRDTCEATAAFALVAVHIRSYRAFQLDTFVHEPIVAPYGRRNIFEPAIGDSKD